MSLVGLLLVVPLELAFQLQGIGPRRRDVLVVLQSTYDDAGSNPNARRELTYLLSRPQCRKLCGISGRNQKVCGIPVGFIFFAPLNAIHPWAHCSVTCGLQEDILLVMQQHMGRLVKEREPELIVRLVPQAELNVHLVASEPSRRTADPRAGISFTNDTTTPQSTNPLSNGKNSSGLPAVAARIVFSDAANLLIEGLAGITLSVKLS